MHRSQRFRKLRQTRHTFRNELSFLKQMIRKPYRSYNRSKRLIKPRWSRGKRRKLRRRLKGRRRWTRTMKVGQNERKMIRRSTSKGKEMRRSRRVRRGEERASFQFSIRCFRSLTIITSKRGQMA